ncbi:DUF4136 domain-containing protein [Pontiella sp.]|uniref:DUF4136 domain-containing protein n=1 Tax=Pontiella sp. TaxID=2837462 RepID=UPI003568EE50
MKRSIFVCLVCCAVLSGCSSVSVRRDYDSSVDFSALKTVAWQHAGQPLTGNPRIDNDLIDDRIRAAVARELAKKGFVWVDQAEADFLVAYFLAYKQRGGFSSISFGVGGGSYGRYGGAGYNPRVSDPEEGVLTIDILNPATNKNYWRGVGRRNSFEGNTPKKTTKIVNSAVADILAIFPPKE